MDYTSVRYKRQVKKLKSLIRKHDEIAILDACLNYLYAPSKDEIEQLRKNPWLILLIIKWVFVEKGKIVYRRDVLDNKRFMHILKTGHALGSVIRMPTEYSHVNLFMRNMAYQQFIYQQPFSLYKYARQSLLFGKLPKNHTLQKWFQTKHGLTCNDFVSLSFTLLVKFIEKTEHTVSIAWFSPLNKKYQNQGTQYLFLFLLAATPISDFLMVAWNCYDNKCRHPPFRI